VRIIGPDAINIADIFCINMLETLKTKTVENFKLNVDLIKDVAGLTGKTVEDITTILDTKISDFKDSLEELFKYSERKTEEINDPTLETMR